MRKAVRSYGLAVGELVWASNYAHDVFGLMCAYLLNNKVNRGAAAWKVINSDALQRAMLAEVAAVRLSETGSMGA